MNWYLVTEDALSEAVGERLISQSDPLARIAVRMGKQGNGYLFSHLPKFIELARNFPVLLLADLDRLECPSSLLQRCFRNRLRPQALFLRVAVREIESWVMADRDAFSEYSGIPIASIPTNPDALADPKQLLLNLVRRHGRRAVREDLLPAPRSTALRGIGYNASLCNFVRSTWSSTNAALNSESLRRSLRRLKESQA